MGSGGWNDILCKMDSTENLRLHTEHYQVSGQPQPCWHWKDCSRLNDTKLTPRVTWDIRGVIEVLVHTLVDSLDLVNLLSLGSGLLRPSSSVQLWDSFACAASIADNPPLGLSNIVRGKVDAILQIIILATFIIRSGAFGCFTSPNTEGVACVLDEYPSEQGI